MLPRECYLRVSWQGRRIVAQRSECPEYFVTGTLLMHMLHTAPRFIIGPHVVCLQIARSTCHYRERVAGIHRTSASVYIYESDKKNILSRHASPSFSTSPFHESLNSLHRNSSSRLIRLSRLLSNSRMSR